MRFKFAPALGSANGEQGQRPVAHPKGHEVLQERLAVRSNFRVRADALAAEFPKEMGFNNDDSQKDQPATLLSWIP